MNRKQARELVMKMLFEMNMNKEYNIELLANSTLEEEDMTNQKEYISQVLETVINNLEKINTVVKTYSKGWTLDRIAKVDLSILQLALVEIIYIDTIPYNVSINEAIELTKKYSSNESASFINGILGGFVEKEGIKKHD
ncbi:MAG: transcription antitermination factor NusB [Clostridiaceae bacterium]|nr:transcription antitermination factor NusB [Clostridiaceae bacterium]